MRTPRRLFLNSSYGMAVAALSTVVGSSSVSAQENWGIQGTVNHGTSLAPQAGIEVRLWAIKEKASSGQIIQRTQTDRNGRFEFRGLENGNDLYQAAVTFDGVEYVGHLIDTRSAGENQENSKQDMRTSNIAVYDISHDAGNISLERINLILAQVNAAAKEVSLIQTVVVSNTGSQTFVADPDLASPVRIAPPVGTVSITPLTGVQHQDLLVTSDGGLVPAIPFRPGETALTIGYSLDYLGPNLSIALPVIQAIAQFRVLLPTEGISLSSEHLSPFGETVVGGRPFAAFGNTDLTPGKLIEFTLNGLPHFKHAAFWTNLRSLQVGIAAVAACVLATLGVLSWADPGSRLRAPAFSGKGQVDRLMNEIQMVEGKAELASQVNRRVLKAQLLEVLSGGERSQKNPSVARTETVAED